MVTGLQDGQGLLDLVNGRVCGAESGESEDDIFSSTAHDIEEMFLSNPFNVRVECTGVADCTSFVHSLVDIVNSDERGKFFSGESVFPDKLPVNAGNVSTRVY